MAKQNLNPFSPFLVNKQLIKLEGAEKALKIKMTAALFPERLHSSFSPLV
jgi:hypothetical protein